MAKVTGVATQKDTSGNITLVTINTQKNPDAITKLKSIGLLEKTKFDREAEKAISVEELRESLHNHINKVWKKK